MNNIILNQFFSLYEFECPCCHLVQLSSELLYKLTLLRVLARNPVIVTSGYRCPSENAKINGDRNSYHMKGMAADVYAPNVYLELLFNLAKEIGFTGIGIYTEKNFLHLDVRPGKKKIWKDPPD